ncbi:uncharacterized protein MEPE_00413 [Melanopsichium pennsylvanicum]|uniref:Uncharacterized protein n=2 Tax=Melanopsichium pennsylvanicum TaxID=63383 RepID=A0AAJ4XGI0_9BASI|nr:hypothetical protein BN887_00316 [Melanopsichium pennsylvanicum 4]SNX81708.1 uncharacterized protein MEPE_00413 [Melanopsichium pennsylvanicum]
MPSFSANRQGHSRPSNISFGRRRSNDKSMPSPSFNSSMSLGHVEDVFCDTSRSVDRLRHHYVAMPVTPSSLSGSSSPIARTQRLPSLTDLFHFDILSPPNSELALTGSVRSDSGGENMQRTDSMSSASSGRSRHWTPTFRSEGQPGSIGPPATPLSPYFGVSSGGPLMSPTTTSTNRTSMKGHSDGERTPRAVSRPSFDFTVSSEGRDSPKCPGAPLVDAQARGHFETQTWQHRDGAPSLGSFESLRQRSSYTADTAEPMSTQTLAKEREAMARLEANMPRRDGLSGLGIYMDEENVQSPFRKAAASTRPIEAHETSPHGRRAVANTHTGLTPLVKASKVTDTSSTPTRPRSKKSPNALKTFSLQTASSTQAKTPPFATAAKKRAETAKTPLKKSRPMFRLDTGSGKKPSKPQGHNMNQNTSPWGVFGAKDGWKPLAPPNVSRAISEANKLVSEIAAAAPPIAPKASPPNKRLAQGKPEAVSPSKRLRMTESRAQSSPYKENMAPSAHAMSPSKRAQLKSPTSRNSPTALPLSTVR